MTNKQLKNLKDTLWTTADQLRANSGLKSTEYAEPILGLIFLRFADVKYSKFEPEIKAEFDSIKGTRMERPIHEIAIEKCGFYLPEEARYDWLLNLPESEDLAKKVKEAMEAVEKYTAELEDTLPKDIYYSVNSEDDPLVLAKLLKNFKDIPADVELDIFGEIYEYFLGEFALAEGQGGGEFFTPASVVRYMVEVLAPTEGRILDPACGSGGMFVQTAHYIEKHKAQGKQMNLRAYGVEKTGATVRLAKMNLVLNNVRGTITHANSYYRDPYDSFGNFDYVMANPPFNVDKVKAESCESAKRLPFGMPSVNKNKEVGNANYLWISYFYSYLNEKGRAGFVMASSATDSQGKDRNIRESLVRTGAVDVMISVGNNFFYTKSLPCSLWFLDKSKNDKIKDKVLFIDARNYYTVVDRTLNEWSEWQLKNLNAIVWLYRGETEKYIELLDQYRSILGNENSFEEYLQLLKEELKDLQMRAKNEIQHAGRNDKKRIQAEYDEMIADRNEKITIAKEANWLYEKFGDGEYKDILGLCKVAYKTEEAKDEDKDGISIEEKGWSLTPGAYVGVAPVEDDGVDFGERMVEIHRELLALQRESNDLMDIISQNMKEIGL